MKPTIKEIEQAIEELKQSLLESVLIDEMEKNAKLAKQKNQYRLSKARDEVRNLKIN